MTEAGFKKLVNWAEAGTLAALFDSEEPASRYRAAHINRDSYVRFELPACTDESLGRKMKHSWDEHCKPDCSQEPSRRI